MWKTCGILFICVYDGYSEDLYGPHIVTESVS